MTLGYWMVLLFVAGLLLAVLKGVARSPGRGAAGYPYRASGPLFTAAERSFLGVLDQAVGTRYRVFGKVRLADVAAARPDLPAGARQGAFNRISAKHFDFLVCGADDLAPVCAIELNDRSHAGRRAQASDALKAGVCQAIGLPLLAVPARRAYSVQEVRERFYEVVSQGTSQAMGANQDPVIHVPAAAVVSAGSA